MLYVKKISAASLLEIISSCENSKPRADNWSLLIKLLLLAPLVTTKSVIPFSLALSNVAIIPGTKAEPEFKTPKASSSNASKLSKISSNLGATIVVWLLS